MSNGAILLLMTALFLGFGYMGVPVAFALMAGVLVACSLTPISMQSMVGQMFHGIDSEILLAVPFFLLVGELMTSADVTNRMIVLLVGLAMVVFGWQNFLNDLGSFRAPSLIPLATYTASVPISGALIVLFSLEQIINGWLHGFEGPEDADDFAGVLK